jgi:hypothetical protein
MFKSMCFLLLVSLVFSCNDSEVSKNNAKFAYISKEKDQSFHDSIANGIKKTDLIPKNNTVYYVT